MGRVCNGLVDEAVDVDESSQSADVQSNVTAGILPQTPAVTLLRGAAMKKVSNVSVQDSASASGGGTMSWPSAVSTRINVPVQLF